MLTTLFLFVNGFILYMLIRPTSDMVLTDFPQDYVEGEIEVASLDHEGKLSGVDAASLNKDEYTQ